MKSIPFALDTHISTRNTTLATALKITRTDNTVYAFTSHDVDDLIDGVNYSSRQGLDPSNIATTAGFSVGNLEIRTIHDGSLFTSKDIIGGLWNNARFVLFRYNWASIADGKEFVLSGMFGNIKVASNMVSIELRDDRQFFQQSIASLSSKTCRDRLGGPRCKFNLASVTFTGAITSATDARIFQDASRAEAADYFGEGSFKFTSGANNGLTAMVSAFAAGGVFTMALPFPVVPAIGDTYVAIAGCRKRLEEDCRDKFNNVLNFYGEPHRVGVNNLTKTIASV